MIGIIDYGMGNLHSVKNALDYLGAQSYISSDVEALMKADGLILPGVGAFEDAIGRLRDLGIDQMLHQYAALNKPILGICLGMQLLFESSSEFGQHKGLCLIPGNIVKLDVPLKVPHMGWNSLHFLHKDPLFTGLEENVHVYFVHSYYLETDVTYVSATTMYGKEIQVAAFSGSVYGLQFHPEKSGEVGLKILSNYIKLVKESEVH